MTFCGNCGAALTQSTSFCGACGKPVASSTHGNPPQPTAVPASGAGWNSVASQPPSAPASWAPGSSQPAQPAQGASNPANASWTPTPAQPPITPQPSGQGWNSPAAAAPAANWNSAGPQASAAAAPAVLASPGTGLTPNIAGALAYSLGIITGVLFLVLEPYRRDRFVRFHAMQSILYFVAAVAFNILWTIGVGILISISGWIALVSFPIRMLISLGLFGLWLFVMFQAYNQKEFRIPIIGGIASKQAG
jgi:uncharacterized membrane protein